MFEYRSHKNFEPNLFNEDLENVPWHIVENEDNIGNALLTWNKLFSEVADDHAPVNDFNSLTQVIRESANINTFKRHVFNFLI